MGRQKGLPSKLNNADEHWSLQKPLDYIPVKKRKVKKKYNPGYIIVPLKDDHKQFHLGELSIGTTDNVLPENWNSCRASFSLSEDDQENLILTFESSCVIVSPIFDKSILKEIISSKVFAINVSQYDKQVIFDLYFITLPLPKFHKKIGDSIQVIFTILYNKSTEIVHNQGEDYKKSQQEDISQIYKNITKYKQLNLGEENVQDPRLKPILRPYQESAVRWMLHRERQSFLDEDMMHPLYTKVKLKSGLEIYYDKYTGYVDITKPVVQKPSLGGILADEMGLGKTVEVLACILLNTKDKANEKASTAQAQNSVKKKEEHDLSGSPSVKILKRKRRLSSSHNDSDLKDSPKKVKVSEDFLPSSSKKSQTRQALEMWYNNCLMDVQKKDKLPNDIPTIQCVCGSNNEDGTVVCVDCSKVQHGLCLGYNSKLHGVYRCPQCWSNYPLLESSATLIITPKSLRTQWCNEISKHIQGKFKVLQYGGTCQGPIYPTELLKYDVVIATYNILQSEFHLTESENTVSLRHKRRYSPPGTPLTTVKWWRLCLDEAQTVEAPTSMVSAMTHKISANIRWAVTGTPISKQISDLYGLIEYLHMEPYNDKLTWKHLLFDPYVNGNPEPIYKFLGKVLWRSAKDDIINQINIPKQTVINHWLQFSAVEQYFYKCEHTSNRDSFLDKIRNYDVDLPMQEMNKSELKKILNPLLSLRHVCTYPNSSRTRYLANKKPVKSMKDLLEALIAKNKNESDEYLRIIFCSLNGLAGIYLLLQNPYEAIKHYREVLQLYSRFTEEEKLANLTVDKLQIVHTMHNLAETLEVVPDIADKTLRDESLRKDCQDVEKQYIKKFISQSMTALQDSLLLMNSVQKLQESFVLKCGKWYSDLLDWMCINDYTHELQIKIHNIHSTYNVQCTIEIKHSRSLLYSITTWYETILELRDKAIDVVNNLYTHCPDDEFQIIVAQELVQKATDCHLRPQKKSKSKNKCPVCVANEELKSYELKLFSMTKRTQAFEEMSLQGAWKPSSEELIFKSILTVGRSKSAAPELLKDGETHINLLDTLKKEFKEIRKFWTFLDRQICAQDELDICKIRLRLKDSSEENEEKSQMNKILQSLTYNLTNKLETIHMLNEHELDYQRTTLINEGKIHRARLEKNLGIRSYLETLRKQQYEGQNPDPCPICKNALEQHYSIIPCGHSYCLECIQILMEQSRGSDVQCSICRVHHNVKDISYIKQGDHKSDVDDIQIKGNYSTKVEGIIKLLLELKTKDPEVKVLIFSSWLSVLSYAKSALIANNISTELVSSSNLEKQIEKFKNHEQNITTLLLPINLGSKGLNLIEATHVILIEPLLNPSDELQAIGRIHRIGQTKPTFVHKFFIKDTIEESIHKATTTNAGKWDKKKVTLRQIKDLFISTGSGVEENTAISNAE